LVHPGRRLWEGEEVRLTPTGLLALALLLLAFFIIGVVAPTVDTALRMGYDWDMAKAKGEQK
jgi:hypothetical protein